MIKFLHLSIYLILFFISNEVVIAQSTSNPKKINSEKSPNESAVGLKQQTIVSENVDDSKNINSNQSLNQNSFDQKEGEIILSNDFTQNIKPIETIPFDYNQMPHDVQAKIDENKATGKNGLAGIAKGFSVEIKSCINSESTKSILSFLNGQNGIIKFEFVSSGIIKIIVHPTFDSVSLKEIIMKERIDFNFLNEFYLINN